ncbi:hypothetical protein CAPTEDRAFT_213886 [Capitella teleta]|uniref:Uncharacterized protein n=1 Tax=Capitella teleta TaxID=283909 RepID=R7T7B4_CAPTE|nr:hypothetical protein CAPTEDRAFT_213886 [Capitella teleta]|eukprot:ELT89288.1 hypothetical protein CAPTEDRAFT_213886 [Capitella teleta]
MAFLDRQRSNAWKQSEVFFDNTGLNLEYCFTEYANQGRKFVFFTTDMRKVSGGHRVVRIPLLTTSTACDAMFESSPGLVKVHEGENADLIWTTTEDITPSDMIRTFYHTYLTGQNNQLLEVIFGSIFTRNECHNRCVLLNGTHKTGVRIPSITTADAKSKYIIFLDVHDGVQNEEGVIYVFREFQFDIPL